MEIYHTIVTFIVGSIGTLGYFGIFILMFLESTFFPFPSEVVLIPAGYLISQGKMDFTLVMLMELLGSIAGAWVNYYIAARFGRKVLLRVITGVQLKKVEVFFQKHGPISTFNGRLVPVVRQYISFPAGLAKMNPMKFTLYTFVGSLVWGLILVSLGYFLGQNEELIQRYLKEITIIVLFAIATITIFYIFYNKRKNNKNKKSKKNSKQ